MSLDVQRLRHLITQVSMLVGLLAFLNQTYSHAALDHALVMAVGTALGVHVILTVGLVGIDRILAYDASDTHSSDDRPDDPSTTVSPDPATTSST